MNLARDDSDTAEDKYKGLVQDSYTSDLLRKEDWDFSFKESSISTSAKIDAGTVAVTAGSTAVTGTGTAWTTSLTDALGWKIKFTSNDVVYRFTASGATDATISPALSGDADITSGGYVVYRDTYALASDFDRFKLGEEGGLRLWRNQRWKIVPLVSYPQWRRQFSPSPTDFTRRARLVDMDSSGNTRIQINPPTDIALSLTYEYIKLLDQMVEYTTGNVAAITNGSTGVTLADSDLDGNIDTANFTYYFRVDDDGTAAGSKWYLVSSVTGNTGLTLATNYLGDTNGSGSATDTYTISRIPEIPYKFHQWLVYNAAMNGIADQGDPNFQYYILRQNQIFNECKKLYKSRRLNKQFDAEDDVRDGYDGYW